MKGSGGKCLSVYMLLTLLVALIIIALAYWVLTTLPLPPMIKTIGTVILVVIVCVWLLNLIAPGTVGDLRL